jgi:uncharacterized phage-like protein YoqJ
MLTPEQLVSELSTFANVMCPKSGEVAAQITKEHRTIQQSIFGLFLRTIEEWSNQENYDYRNEFTVQKSKEIMELMHNCSAVPFI